MPGRPASEPAPGWLPAPLPAPRPGAWAHWHRIHPRRARARSARLGLHFLRCGLARGLLGLLAGQPFGLRARLLRRLLLRQLFGLLPGQLFGLLPGALFGLTLLRQFLAALALGRLLHQALGLQGLLLGALALGQFLLAQQFGLFAGSQFFVLPALGLALLRDPRVVRGNTFLLQPRLLLPLLCVIFLHQARCACLTFGLGQSLLFQRLFGQFPLTRFLFLLRHQVGDLILDLGRRRRRFDLRDIGQRRRLGRCFGHDVGQGHREFRFRIRRGDDDRRRHLAQPALRRGRLGALWPPRLCRRTRLGLHHRRRRRRQVDQAHAARRRRRRRRRRNRQRWRWKWHWRQHRRRVRQRRRRLRRWRQGDADRTAAAQVEAGHAELQRQQQAVQQHRDANAHAQPPVAACPLGCSPASAGLGHVVASTILSSWHLSVYSAVMRGAHESNPCPRRCIAHLLDVPANVPTSALSPTCAWAQGVPASCCVQLGQGWVGSQSCASSM